MKLCLAILLMLCAKANAEELSAFPTTMDPFAPQAQDEEETVAKKKSSSSSRYSSDPISKSQLEMRKMAIDIVMGRSTAKFIIRHEKQEKK